jgi:hypothetical protein
MGEPTIETARRERLEAWLYTGPPGRLLSFAIDLSLALAALALYEARRAWARIRSSA